MIEQNKNELLDNVIYGGKKYLNYKPKDYRQILNNDDNALSFCL